MARQPRYSVAAASEMVAMRSTFAAAVRYPAKKVDIPGTVVSAAMIGTQSNPMSPVWERE